MSDDPSNNAPTRHFDDQIRDYARCLCENLARNSDALPQPPDRAEADDYIPRQVRFASDSERTPDAMPENVTFVEAGFTAKVREPRQRLLVVGEGGMGKTRMLEHLALELAGELDKAPQAASVPVLVPLRKWESEPLPAHPSSHGQLLPFIASYISKHGRGLPAPVLAELAASGRLIILFDGLDEISAAVPSKGRDDFISTLRRETVAGGLLHSCSIIISSRRAGVAGPQRNLPAVFAEHELLPLGIPEIRRRIDQAGVRSEDVHPQMLRLCTQPLRLTLFCKFVRKNEGRLPKSSVELMQLHLINAFIRREMPPERWDELQNVLKPLCFMLAKDDFVRKDRNQIIRDVGSIIDGEQEARRAIGLLTGPGPGSDIVYHHPSDDTISVSQTPLVEYLIGLHLADSVTQSGGLRTVAEVFQRWAFRSERFAALEYALGKMWESNDRASLAIPGGLIAWLLKHAESHDDWCHPIAILSARLLGTAPIARPADDNPQRRAESDEEDWFRTLCWSTAHSLQKSWHRIVAGNYLIGPLIAPFVDAAFSLPIESGGLLLATIRSGLEAAMSKGTEVSQWDFWDCDPVALLAQVTHSRPSAVFWWMTSQVSHLLKTSESFRRTCAGNPQLRLLVDGLDADFLTPQEIADAVGRLLGCLSDCSADGDARMQALSTTRRLSERIESASLAAIAMNIVRNIWQ